FVSGRRTGPRAVAARKQAESPETKRGDAQQRFYKQEQDRERRTGPRAVAARKQAESPETKRGDAQQRQAAGRAVGGLDDGFDARGTRHHYAIAQRPTVAATGPRASGAHE